MNSPKFLTKSEILLKFKDKISQFVNIDAIFITKEVIIGEGNIIFPNVYLIGKVVIGNNNKLQMGVVIQDSIIGNNNLIGPYSFIRKNSLIHNSVTIGPYCEIKRVDIKNKVIISHKSFIGDSEISENSSIGAGVTVANFDGKKIVKTIIGKNTFIGANVTLVAPLNIASNVFVAAGSTITQNIDKPAKVFARIKDMTLKEL